VQLFNSRFMKKYLLLLSLAGFSLQVSAQYVQKSTGDGSDLQREKSISLGLGTTGVSLEGKVGLNQHFNARLGVSFLPVTYSGPLTLDGVKTTANITANLGKVSLLGEYKPFNTLPIRLVGGVGYIFSASPTATLQPTQSYKLGQTTLSPNELGEMKIGANWQGIAPYLGVAFCHDFPKHKFNVNVDLGTYYLPKPTTTWEGTKLLNDNQSNEQQLDQNLSGYRWFPELKISLNYKIGK